MSNFHCQRELSNQGYSFCIFTRSFRILQNRDPNDFVSFEVRQSVLARVFIVKIQGFFSTKRRPPWFRVSWCLTKRFSSEIMTPLGSIYPYRQCIGVPFPLPQGPTKCFSKDLRFIDSGGFSTKWRPHWFHVSWRLTKPFSEGLHFIDSGGLFYKTKTPVIFTSVCAEECFGLVF